jgi:hypothetical protein
MQNTSNGLEQDKLILERTKLAADIVKHISTLATGSIVLVPTFTDKIHNPILKSSLLVTAIAALMICLLCCVVYLFLVGVPSRWDATVVRPTSVRWGMQCAAGALYVSFAVGVKMLGFFGIANI